MILRLKKLNVFAAFVTLLFFWYIHPFYFKGTTMAFNLLRYGLPVFFLILSHIYTSRALSILLNRKGQIYVIWLFLFILWSAITILLNFSGDVSFLNTVFSVLRTLTYFMFVSLFLEKPSHYSNRNRKPLPEQFMTFYVAANVLFVSFTLILVCFPSFKEFWFSVLPPPDALEATLRAVPHYRNRIGISGFAGYRNTFGGAVSVAFALFLSEKYPKERKKYLFFASLCLGGNVFYGRSGLAMATVSFLLYVICYKKLSVKSLIVAASCAVIVYVIWNAVLLSMNNSLESTLSWATSSLIELATTGKTTNSSFNRMVYDMTFMPPLKTLLLGDGYYTDSVTGRYYMQTDLGFMRVTLFGGIPACLMIYGTILLGILQLRKRSGYLTLALILTFAAFEFKGDIWFSFMPILMILCILDGLEGTYDTVYQRYYERLS